MGMIIDEKKAFECYLKSAEKGNHKAQYCLGRLYKHGVRTVKDLNSLLKEETEICTQ